MTPVNLNINVKIAEHQFPCRIVPRLTDAATQAADVTDAMSRTYATSNRVRPDGYDIRREIKRTLLQGSQP